MGEAARSGRFRSVLPLVRLRRARPDWPIPAALGLSELGLVDDAFIAAEAYEPGMHMTGASAYQIFFAPTLAMRRDTRFIKLAAKWGLVDFWRESGNWPDFCSDPDLPNDCKVEAERLLSKQITAVP